MPDKRLQRSFFLRDTHVVAQQLLGKVLTHTIGTTSVSCRIVETESYVGDDLASHASRGRTPRTEMMFAVGGHAYVYFIYGMYWCLNVVTEKKDFPAAVLIRAGEPLTGIAAMQTARQRENLVDLASGPGKLCQAMHVTGEYNGEDLVASNHLFISDDGYKVSRDDIAQSPRIGVAYAGDDALKPWRYFLKDSPWISKRVPVSV